MQGKNHHGITESSPQNTRTCMYTLSPTQAKQWFLKLYSLANQPEKPTDKYMQTNKVNKQINTTWACQKLAAVSTIF